MHLHKTCLTKQLPCQFKKLFHINCVHGRCWSPVKGSSSTVEARIAKIVNINTIPSQYLGPPTILHITFSAVNDGSWTSIGTPFDKQGLRVRHILQLHFKFKKKFSGVKKATDEKAQSTLVANISMDAEMEAVHRLYQFSPGLSHYSTKKNVPMSLE